jgi:hypothetical protein
MNNHRKKVKIVQRVKVKKRKKYQPKLHIPLSFEKAVEAFTAVKP